MRIGNLPVGWIMLAVGCTAATGVALAGGRAAHDLSVKMKVGDVATLGPEARIKVKNRGTSQESAVVRLFADSTDGAELWSETVDLLPGKSATFAARVYPETDASLLVVDVQPADEVDANPADNQGRAALWVKGKSGTTLLGRAVHLDNCAECHGDAASGGTGPSLVRARSKAIFAAAHADEDGEHGFPWLTKSDAKALSKFYKDPAKVVLAPEPPTPPEGGWPTYAADIQPIMEEKCSPCHTRQSKAGVGVGSYRGAAKNASRSLSSIRRGGMPKGGKFGSENFQTLQNWIIGGRRP